MTQREFVQYLHDNDCELKQEDEGIFYTCKRREYKAVDINVVIPKLEQEEEVLHFVACFACHYLEVEPPSELKGYYQDFFIPSIIQENDN